MAVTKRITAIALTLLLALSLAACNGNPPAGGENSPPPNSTAASDDDPCACCPNCNQDDCEYECKECECCAGSPGSPPPITYNVEIKTEWKDVDATCPYPGECGGVSVSAADVTVDWAEDGYNGTGTDGLGEYTSYNSHYWDSAGREMFGHAAPGTTFGFSAMLSIPGDDVIRVGLRFYGEGDVTMHWPNGETLPFPGMMKQIYGWFSGTVEMFGVEFDTSGILDPDTFVFDHDTGMILFELPLVEGVMQETFHWDNRGLTITITLMPVDG